MHGSMTGGGPTQRVQPEQGKGGHIGVQVRCQPHNCTSSAASRRRGIEKTARTARPTLSSQALPYLEDSESEDGEDEGHMSLPTRLIRGERPGARTGEICGRHHHDPVTCTTSCKAGTNVPSSPAQGIKKTRMRTRMRTRRMMRTKTTRPWAG